MNKNIWNEGTAEEIYFWDYWFNDKGIHWPADYTFRLNPDTELQVELKIFLEGKNNVRILDVGAGPLTFLGKNFDGHPLMILAIDALAEDYDKLLDKHEIIPMIRTKKWDSEDLDKLPEDYGMFDLIVAQNTLDHSYDPVSAILFMPKLLKPGGVIWLKHYINEAERGKYNGLHQWNFYMENECLMIGSKDQVTNLTEYFKDIHGGFSHEYQLTPGNEVIYIIKKLKNE
jgi:SAM-dependent methyltransferase